MSHFTVGWYVIYTRPRHEKKIAEELAAQKIDFYLPIKKTLRMWHDRKKFVDLPVFQSYVFVYLKSLKDYYDGLSIQGVLQYVRFGKEIARVKDTVINEMRLLIDYGSNVEVSSENFQRGQQLYIQHGPLTGISCEMVEVDGKQKILVRISLLQRSLLISLPTTYLTAVPT
jgi:transcription antitermination factor NusG